MNLDEQFLEMTDKIRLIKLENENVTLFSYTRNLKTPTVAILLGFFFILKSNEQSNE